MDAIEEWFTGRPVAPPVRTDRVLATVVFTDIVGSTSLAAELGDAEWRSRLDAHDAIIADQVARYGGRLVKTTGDGVLATFDGPTAALDSAEACAASCAATDCAHAPACTPERSSCAAPTTTSH